LSGLRHDGSEFPAEASISATYVSGQKLITLILRDITRRRQVEQSLRDSEARFHGIFDGLLEGCQIIGFDYRYLYINASAARQSRSVFGERLGRTMMEVLPGVEKTGRFALIERCMRERISERHETRVELPDGSLQWLEVSMQPVPDGVLILTMDITQRHQMEESLRASEARFHDLFDGLLEGCQIIGFDWRYLYINAAAGRNSRTAPEDRLGKTVMEVFPGVDRTASFKMFERCMYERLPSRHES
jgi:PAS domain S-box-containing protein